MRAVLSVACALLSGAGTAHAQYSQKVAASGVPIVLTQVWSANPDCTSTGNITLRVISAPTHGRVSIVRGKVFPNFPASNPRYHCNARGVMGVKAMYVSRRGYTGHDAAALEVIFPSGNYRRGTFGVSVR
jgi:hypothetical protein